jgi:hypothetical protein
MNFAEGSARGRGGLAAGLILLLLCGACSERERSRISDGRLAISGPAKFGTVAVHKTVELELGLTNVGRSNVNLEKVSADGPLNTFQAWLLDPEEKGLVSGQQVRLKIRYTPREEGEHPGELVVHTDSAEEPIFRVDLSGQGLNAAARIYNDRLDYGRIEADARKALFVDMENPSPLPIDVRTWRLGPDQDELHTEETLTLAPGEKRRVEVAFAPTRVGRKQVAMSITPCEGCAEVPLPVSAEALEQAVVADPPMLEFGQVSVDRDVERPLTLTNLSTEPARIDQHFFNPGSDASFSLTQATPLPMVLQPGEQRQFAIRYSPGHMGPAAGQWAVRVPESIRHPTTDVTLKAHGGSSEICVSPRSFDFGEVPVGAKVAAPISIKNCGASTADPLQIDSIALGDNASLAPGGGSDQYGIRPVQLPRALAAGEELTATLYFEPTRAGITSAEVTVTARGEPVKLAFAGRAREVPPCELAISPGEINFGTLPPRQGAVLGVKIQNNGSDVCPIKNIRLREDAGGAFTLPGEERLGVILERGSYFSMMVAYKSRGDESVRGEVEFEANHAGRSVQRIPVRANSQASCLVASPPYLDFGFARPDCAPAVQRTNLENICSQPVVLGNAAIGAGTTDGEFLISGQLPELPAALQPGETTGVEVRYLAQVAGMNLSPLFLSVDGLREPLMVTLLGESSSKAIQTDRFVQQHGRKVDVLLVIDNTASMVEELPKLRAALPTFVQGALSRGVDLRIAVTTTGIESASSACPGGAEGGEAGRLFPADGSAPRILDGAMPDLQQRLMANAEVGRCAFVEKGLEAMRRALTAPLVDQADDPRTPIPDDGNFGFLREEAALVVVLVGDEDDHSPDTVANYVTFLRGLKGLNQPGRATIYAIAPVGVECGTAGGSGNRSAEAAKLSGGEALSICAPDYAPLLASVASRAFGPQEIFPLSAQPDAPTIEVQVNGSALTSGWNYQPETNQVRIDPRPAEAAKIHISYRKLCPGGP